jgi:hypothetical protein
MNSWFTVKIKYTKQLDDGTFKRVSEPYLIAAMSFTDAEARVYDELGSSIRGEMIVSGISRADFHDIFYYEDADIWYKCKIVYESGDGGEEGAKAKKIAQNFLITAHSVHQAYERLKESLHGMMIDYVIPSIIVSPIVDVFPFKDSGEIVEKQPRIEEIDETPTHNLGKKTVFSASGTDEDEDGFDEVESSIEDDFQDED